ncbi:hypothetical protein AAY473_031353, partial [Plecturocebus cupreus]
MRKERESKTVAIYRYKPGRGSSPGNESTGTLTLDFRPLELAVVQSWLTAISASWVQAISCLSLQSSWDYRKSIFSSQEASGLYITHTNKSVFGRPRWVDHLSSGVQEQSVQGSLDTRYFNLLKLGMKKRKWGWVPWLMPVIPALWEAQVYGSPEIRSLRPAWPSRLEGRTVVLSWHTTTSASEVQAILISQPPEYLELQCFGRQRWEDHLRSGQEFKTSLANVEAEVEESLGPKKWRL